MTVAMAGDMVAARAHAEEAVRRFRAQGERQRLVDTLPMTEPPAIYEMDLAAFGAAIPTGITAVEEARALARDIGWRSGEAYAVAILGEGLGAAGEFGRALDLLEQSVAIAEEIEHRQWQVQARWGLGFLSFDLGSWDEARSQFEAALALANEIRSPLWLNIVSSGLASTLIAQGDLTGAMSVLDAAFLPERPMRTLAQRRLWGSWVEVQLALETADANAAALDVLDRLYSLTPNLQDGGDVPRLAELKARALAASGQLGPAITLLRAAKRTAESMGLRPTRARLQAELATLLFVPVSVTSPSQKPPRPAPRSSTWPRRSPRAPAVTGIWRWQPPDSQNPRGHRARARRTIR